MADTATIILITALFAQAICAPQAVTEKSPSTFQSPANLSIEEITYIIKVRSGNVNDASPPRFLTPCARAILGCCNGSVINENCSESLKCGAFFFDANPCDDKFISEALQAARGFYEQFNVNAVGN